MHRECYEQPARLITLFDCRNGRGSARDRYSLANNSAKYSASEWRDIGYGTASRFCFILTNDVECLRPAVIAPHSYCGPEMYFAFVGCRFDDLRGRSSCIPVAKFTLRRCDRCPIVFSYRGLGHSPEVSRCPLLTQSGHEIRVGRLNGVQQVQPSRRPGRTLFTA
jgi:hypothetical protein